jgi:hypothetical protein
MSESRDMLDFAKAVAKALYWGLVFVGTLTGLYAVIFGIAEPFYWLLVPVAMALPGAWLARFPGRVWIGFFVLAFVPAILQSVLFVVSEPPGEPPPDSYGRGIVTLAKGILTHSRVKYQAGLVNARSSRP